MADFQIEHTVENGYALGRPPGRELEEVDIVIEEAISLIPMAPRLYPEVYAWRITEALRSKGLLKETS